MFEDAIACVGRGVKARKQKGRGRMWEGVRKVRGVGDREARGIQQTATVCFDQSRRSTGRVRASPSMLSFGVHWLFLGSCVSGRV